MLGSECNMNCTYCIQKNNKKNKSIIINKDIIKFIRFVAKNNFNQTLEIYFFGGEPLLFWTQIKEITEDLLNIKNIRFTIITNGKELDKEKVLYLNSRKFKIIVSWDGNKSKYTRNYDVIINNKDNILKCQDLTLSGVISKDIYPLELLKDFSNFNDIYKKTNNHDIKININLPIITNSNPIFDINLEDIYNDYYRLVFNFLKSPYLISLQNTYIQNLINRIKNQINSNNKLDSLCICKNGYNILNLDLEGNLYHCNETSIKIGTIYDDYYEYLNEVIKTDIKDKKCLSCEAYPLCGGGCKLIKKTDNYCNIRKTIIAAITNSIKDWNNNVFSDSSN